MVQSLMATIFPKDGSPFYFIKYKDPAGKWRMKSTKLRWDNRDQANEAKALCATTTAEEIRNGSASDKEGWGAWVQGWLDLKYPEGSQTRLRYQTCWNSLHDYLKAKNILSPRHLTYESVMEYFPWRKANSVLKKGVCKNTVLYEIKLLKLIMRQAIRRFSLTMANPCEKLDVSREAVKIKPEITKAHQKVIRQGLKAKPEWMRICFEIGLCQGCRLAETRVPLSRIDVERKKIQWHAKGAKIRTTPLHRKLIPMIRKLQKEGKTHTWEPPAACPGLSQWASTEWGRFFKKIGLPQYCFHCTRVTCITWLARAKVTERDAMEYVGHSSVDVHRIYQRVQSDDLLSCEKALRF